MHLLLEFNPYGGGIDSSLVSNLQESGVELRGDSRTFNYTHEKSMVIIETY